MVVINFADNVRHKFFGVTGYSRYNLSIIRYNKVPAFPLFVFFSFFVPGRVTYQFVHGIYSSSSVPTEYRKNQLTNNETISFN